MLERAVHFVNAFASIVYMLPGMVMLSRAEHPPNAFWGIVEIFEPNVIAESETQSLNEYFIKSATPLKSTLSNAEHPLNIYGALVVRLFTEVRAKHFSNA